MDTEAKSNAGELVMALHLVRRVRDIEKGAQPGCRAPREVMELYRAAVDRLSNITALELAVALIDYRRVTGVPFKL